MINKIKNTYKELTTKLDAFDSCDTQLKIDSENKFYQFTLSFMLKERIFEEKFSQLYMKLRNQDPNKYKEADLSLIEGFEIPKMYHKSFENFSFPIFKKEIAKSKYIIANKIKIPYDLTKLEKVMYMFKNKKWYIVCVYEGEYVLKE